MCSEVPCPRQDTDSPCKGTHCKRVSRSGVIYRCTTSLAATLGVSRGAVQKSLSRHGDAEHVGIRKGIRPGSGKANHTKPIQVGPHKWPSITAMAQTLTIERSLLCKKIKADPQSVLALVMERLG